MTLAHALPIVWACIAAFTILAYIVLDGFDLGLGILFALERDPHDRDVMITTVAPVWDGNETWLILGGASLYAVFPIAYGTILPALYPPLIAMLLALIFRGVAFEFRFKVGTGRARRLWDLSFFWDRRWPPPCRASSSGRSYRASRYAIINTPAAGSTG